MLSITALSIKRSCCMALLCLALLISTTQGQQDARTTAKPSQDEEVVRINTALVQTDVMVFDKDGRFVDGLKPEQFELRIDGKSRPISFFERVTAGSVNEDAQLAAARGKPRTPSAKDELAPKPLDRGRTILFFVDDLHLDASNLPRIRAMLQHFVENEIGQNDQVAITSSSGQIGFLQQLTDNKTVLRAAVGRLKLQQRKATDLERPPMREYQALAIAHYNRDVTDYFVDRMLAENPSLNRDSATEMVRSRARTILYQAANITNSTLASLASLMRSSSPVPGRKILFFISDGFFIDDETAKTTFDLRRITDAAAQAGVVIYSMDARGLVASLTDASSDVAFDPTGRLSRYDAGELLASQDALNALAVDTGGRALFNTNALDPIVTKALQETSIYYLLAWRPETEEQRSNKFRRIEVKVTGRPELSVRVRRGYFDAETGAAARRNTDEAPRAPVKTVDDALRVAIKSLYPASALPTQLALAYVDAPKTGAKLTALIQVDSQFISFDQSENNKKGIVDIAGVVMNDQGKSATGFRDHLNIVANLPSAPEGTPPNLIYNYQANLAPGLYQVRIATRDERSGRVGSAMQWIEIPDLASHKLSLSSLIIAEVTKEAESLITDTAAVAQSRPNVDHRFDRASKLRFVTFVYNASRGANGAESPDLALQVQILRDDQPVLTTPLRKVEYTAATDLSRLPYAADIPLTTMLPGRYVLQVTVIDRIAKTSISQRANFEIE